MIRHGTRSLNSEEENLRAASSLKLKINREANLSRGSERCGDSEGRKRSKTGTKELVTTKDIGMIEKIKGLHNEVQLTRFAHRKVFKCANVQIDEARCLQCFSAYSRRTRGQGEGSASFFICSS